MQFIVPVPMTDARLISSTLPETDHAAWLPAASYAVGNRVVRTQTHRIYECLVAGVSSTPPEASPTRWLNVGPTNRWAAFDNAVGTRSVSAGGNILIAIAPGQRVDSVALLDVVCESAVVRVFNGSSATVPVYERALSLLEVVEPIVDYYTYWQAEFFIKGTGILSDLPSASVPTQIEVELVGGAPQMGTLVVGNTFQIGDTRYGMSLGIDDYSTKTRDTYGVVTVLERAWVSRLEASVVCQNLRVDALWRALTAVRATPVVWIGLGQYDAAVVYGFPKSWRVAIDYATESLLNIEIEGLT